MVRREVVQISKFYVTTGNGFGYKEVNTIWLLGRVRRPVCRFAVGVTVKVSCVNDVIQVFSLFGADF